MGCPRPGRASRAWPALCGFPLAFMQPHSLKLERADGLTHVFVRPGWQRTDQACAMSKEADRWVCRSGSELFEPLTAGDSEHPPEGPWACDGSTFQLTYLHTSAKAEEYLRQEVLRPWDDMLAHLQQHVSIKGTVYDLGCGAGAMSKRLASMPGVHLRGFDLDAEMVATAAVSCPSGRFEVRPLEVVDLAEASGGWCSFVLAYLAPDQVQRWAKELAPNAWLCLVEIDGLFSAHGMQFQGLDDGLRALGYDCFAGRRLRACCEEAGLEVLDERCWRDEELYFDGAATEAQLAAWTRRLRRPQIQKLLASCGLTDEDFLGCLRCPEHRAVGGTRMVIARKTD
ncbi:unnamed protein product [Effrenium voratum]|nr:unnamed protein product [Effrenium voratum]